MHYAVPRAFHQHGQLERFCTDIYVSNKPWLTAILKEIAVHTTSSALQRWRSRSDPTIPAELVHSFDLLGFRLLYELRRSSSNDEREAIFASVGEAFCQKIVAKGLGAADAIWAFNTAALELFEEAKRRGAHCILEQSIVPKVLELEAMAIEAERWPGWDPGIHSASAGSPLAKREEREWVLADRIIAGSLNVVRGLAHLGVDQRKCVIVPYGVEANLYGVRSSPPRPQGPLHLLFAGEVGLRKGAPYLLEALHLLHGKNIEARFAGKISIAEEYLVKYRDVATFLGVVPRPQMTDLLAWADLLVLPSICEGSATVTYEALVAGVPVICTENTGSVVRDGVDGRIVPVRDTESLAEIIQYYTANRDEIVALSAAALHGAHRLSRAAYGDRLMAAVNGRSI